MGVVLCSCRDPDDLCPSFCVVVATLTSAVSGQEMSSDGFQTQKSKSWIPGKERVEKVFCKFCSETNVWTRWRCVKVILDPEDDVFALFSLEKMDIFSTCPLCLAVTRFSVHATVLEANGRVPYFST